MTSVGHAFTDVRVVRIGVSLGLLVGLGWFLNVGQIAARLGRLRVVWICLALGISVIQVAASAWRWRFTAGRLGIDLPFPDAVREYYLAMFLNQVMPGGVVGDVSRAWRHARARSNLQTPGGPAVRAVILERVSGQVVMTLVATLSFTVLPLSLGAVWWLALVGIGTVIGSTWVWARRRESSARSLLGQFWCDARTALLAGRAFPVQLISSAVIVSSYIVMYLVAARAVGVETSFLVLVPLVAPVLVTMLVPVTVAGWGVREGVAAALWGAVGLAAVDGVAISVAYGLLVLLSTLPGGVVLALGPTLQS